ncbi:MAG: DUF1992 domain-containing protein [Pseudomonadales bacterium]|nr:DUF1992 domain-containing protein [Pseudomonadales bacterium]
MKIYDAVEQQIQEAIKRGDFDNLPNKGQPIDLSDWQRTPEHLRMSYSVLKNAGIRPVEIDNKQQIALLKAEIQTLDKVRDKERRTELLNKLNELMLTYSLRMERLRRR